MDNITLRKMSPLDCLGVWEWRNEHKKYFVNQNHIPLFKHIPWFTKQFFKKDSHMFIVMIYGIPVGMIGIDIEKGGWQGTLQRVVLGDQRFARAGIMGEALEKVITMFPLHLYKLDVLRDNSTAVKFYKKHGFSIDEENSNERTFRMKRYEKAD